MKMAVKAEFLSYTEFCAIVKNLMAEQFYGTLLIKFKQGQMLNELEKNEKIKV